MRLGFHGGAREASQQEADMALFTKLVIRTASARTWSMATWSELPPETFCGVASSNMAEANAAFAQARADAEYVKAALQATRAAPRHAEHEAATEC